MKKLWTLVAVSGMLSVAGFTYAGSGCSAAKSECSKSEKVACTKSEAQQVGMTYGGAEGSDAKACAAACATACAKSEADQVSMTYGGADGSTTTGYELGKKVPDFTLADSTGTSHNLSDFKGQVVVLVFYNHECPWVVEVQDRLSDFTKKYSEKGVKVLAIDAGDNNTTEAINAHAQQVAYPILVNNDSMIARKFDAKRTPEVFILDKEGVIQYHGAFDSGKVTDEVPTRTTFAQNAVDELIAGKEVTVQKTKAFGCTVKYNKKTTASAEEAKAAKPGV